MNDEDREKIVKALEAFFEVWNIILKAMKFCVDTIVETMNENPELIEQLKKEKGEE